MNIIKKRLPGFTLQEILITMIATSIISYLALQLLTLGWGSVASLTSGWVEPFAKTRLYSSLRKATDRSRLIEFTGNKYLFITNDADTVLQIPDSVWKALPTKLQVNMSKKVKTPLQ